MSVAYFIRRRGDVCAVIKLLPDNQEEVVQDGMSLIEAEILYVAKIEDLPRPVQLIPEQRTTEAESSVRMERDVSKAREAYETDRRARPFYDDDSPRPAWEQLELLVQWRIGLDRSGRPHRPR